MSTHAATAVVEDYGSQDGAYEKNRVEENHREYSYMLLGGSKMVYLTAARLVGIRFVATMSASADVLAMASMELDIGNIDEGACSYRRACGVGRRRFRLPPPTPPPLPLVDIPGV
jgi:hypothetical protein